MAPNCSLQSKFREFHLYFHRSIRCTTLYKDYSKYNLQNINLFLLPHENHLAPIVRLTQVRLVWESCSKPNNWLSPVKSLCDSQQLLCRSFALKIWRLTMQRNRVQAQIISLCSIVSYCDHSHHRHLQASLSSCRWWRKNDMLRPTIRASAERASLRLSMHVVLADVHATLLHVESLQKECHLTLHYAILY